METNDSGMTLRVGSNVKHEPFVLGGKVPSWTPIAPLKSWVERKGLSWTDKKSGKLLTVEQIAHMIQAKIKREGIAARNVFAQVIANGTVDISTTQFYRGKSMSAHEKFIADRNRIVDALKFCDIPTIQFNKDSIPKQLPCAIVILIPRQARTVLQDSL